MLRYDKVLFVGTGGGNDVFSTTLAMLALREIGFEWNSCAVAGVLSPFHRHEGLILTEDPNVAVVPESGSVRRIVPRLRDPIETGVVENAVAALAATERDLRVEAVYGLMLHNGTAGLAESFRRLKAKYGQIVLVDIGGDIFFRGRGRDPHVLSPMFDAMVLEAFCGANVPGVLFEAGPGTDGEIDRASLAESLSASIVVRRPLSASVIDAWERLYRTHVETIRPGRTVPKTIEAFRSDSTTLTLDYRARCHLGTHRWYAAYPHEIDAAMNRSFYLVMPQWVRERNPFCIECHDVMDWIRATRPIETRTNGEYQFEYLERDGRLFLLALPSPLFSGEQRSEMMEAARQDLDNGNCHDLILDEA